MVCVFECLSHWCVGQVQSKKCMEEVLHFAHEENLFVMADEVNSIVTCCLCIVYSMNVLKRTKKKSPFDLILSVRFPAVIEQLFPSFKRTGQLFIFIDTPEHLNIRDFQHCLGLDLDAKWYFAIIEKYFAQTLMFNLTSSSMWPDRCRTVGSVAGHPVGTSPGGSEQQ